MAGGSRISPSRACIAPRAPSRWKRHCWQARACAACKSTALRRRRASSGRPAAGRPSDWFKALKRAGYGALPAADLLSAVPRLRAQRLLLWRWLVAGFCMMQVMMYATPAYVAQPGEITPGHPGAAALGLVDPDLARAAVLLPAVLRVGLARPAPRGASAWTCRWRWAGHRLRRKHRRDLRSQRGHGAARSGTTRSACSSSSCCPGGCWSSGLRDSTAGSLEALAAPDARYASSGCRPTASSSALRCASLPPATGSACCRARCSLPTEP